MALMLKASGFFLLRAIRPVRNKVVSAVIDLAGTFGVPSLIGAAVTTKVAEGEEAIPLLERPATWIAFAVVVALLFLWAGIRVQHSLMPHLTVKPYKSWEYLRPKVSISIGGKTASAESPAVFAGLRVTNDGKPQSAHAHVTYSDGRDASDWPPPWQEKGEEYTDLSQGQPGRLFLFAIENLDDGRFRVHPFRTGLADNGLYEFHPSFTINKPFRFTARVWGEGPGYIDIEARCGINKDDTPHMEFLKKPMYGP